ncbi:hypothetical protein VL15_34895 [Burkholderia cepacia]|uniref:Uncharacterized protein n=1 Tax=Burkholderia cepacia TaxID=292 RepID=A0A0J5W7D9_BURCE|nr:hypothetical protein VL15_34895 [Burkholderia cepacia]
MKIERANQAWALDTTYAPMARGFVSLITKFDKFSGHMPMYEINASWQQLLMVPCTGAVQNVTEQERGMSKIWVFQCSRGKEAAADDSPSAC